MSNKPLDTVQGLRGLLEDIVSPSIRQIQAEVSALRETCGRLGSEILEHRKAHRDFLVLIQEQISTLNTRIGRLEGRSEGLKEELTAALQLELLKASRSLPPVPRTSFLTSGEPASEP